MICFVFKLGLELIIENYLFCLASNQWMHIKRMDVFDIQKKIDKSISLIRCIPKTK